MDRGVDIEEGMAVRHPSNELDGLSPPFYFRPSRRYRLSMALCASASVSLFAIVILSYRRLPALPTDFSRAFHQELNVSLSAELFDLTLLACQRTAFCQHLVIECAPSDDNDVGDGEENSVECEDMRCCLALPSLAADIQRVYLERLHRQPDTYGIEYYCKKISSGELTINHMRLRMAASPEGRERSKAARVDDYLDKIFADMPQLLRDLCQAYQSDLCTSATLRQLLLMLYKGQVNVAYVEQVLRPNSNLWQTHAMTFNMMFTEILCREPEPAEFRENNRLLSQIMTLITTWDTLRDRWKSSEEGQWCAYRRRVESHALLLSGDKLGRAGKVTGLSSEGCTLPVLASAHGGPDSGGGMPGYPKTARIALYPHRECTPLFDLVTEATENNAPAIATSPQLRNILRSRHGHSFARTRAQVQSTYCEMLGHLPAAHQLSEHLARLMTWRSSIADVRSMVRGSVEMQFRKLWLDLRRQMPLLAASLHSSLDATVENAQRRQVALEALAAAIMSGEASLQDPASLHSVYREVLSSRTSMEGAARRASAFFERTYMQVTGQFSLAGDVLLRQKLVSALREGSMTEAGVAQALAHTCLVTDACLECAPYSNLSQSAPYLEASSSKEGAGDGYGQDADGEIVAGANPCCCSGGKLRAQLLELFGHDSPQRLGVLGSMGNATMQGALLEVMQQTFGRSETGARHMSALLNRRLAPDVTDIPHCIVLYVHNRPDYFQQVLDELRGVHGIEQALLIVSFDGLFRAMLEVAKSIDFCRVRFLVHTSRQTLPHLQSLVAIKEHWWWLVEQVFTAIPETRNRNGFVLFLEEDHIVAPDALTVTSALAAHIQSGGCNRCWGLGLRFGCSKPDASDATGVCVSDGFVNTGYAFNRSVFDILQKHKDLFWAFSEGWDYSIFHLIQMGVMAPMNLAPRASRCRNIGAQGATVDASNRGQLDYELVEVPGQLRAVEPDKLIHEPGAQYGRPVQELPYYAGVSFPKPYLSFGLGKTEEEAALEACREAAAEVELG